MEARPRNPQGVMRLRGHLGYRQLEPALHNRCCGKLAVCDAGKGCRRTHGVSHRVCGVGRRRRIASRKTASPSQLGRHEARRARCAARPPDECAREWWSSPIGAPSGADDTSEIGRRGTPSAALRQRSGAGPPRIRWGDQRPRLRANPSGLSSVRYTPLLETYSSLLTREPFCSSTG